MTISQAFEIAVRSHQAGRLADAEALYLQILATQPAHPEARHLLGIVAHQSGRHELAVTRLRQAIALSPNYPASHWSHCGLAEACHALGRLDDAIAAYRAALELKPDFPEAHINLGAALSARGDLDEAIAAYRRALHIDPKLPEAHNNLGNALRTRSQFDEAIAAYRRALELRPDYPDAHNNLGSALRERGQLDEAIAAYRRALEFKPDFPAACNNLGNALRERGHLDEAVAAYRRAIALKPDYPDAHNNLGIAFKEQGEWDQALTAFRRVLQLKPDDPSSHSNLVFSLHYHPEYDARMIAEERRRWTQRFSDPLKPFIRPHSNDPSPNRRLRIGYVSADFWTHVVGRYLLPLFRCHDPRNFEILCYSGVVRPDSLTEEFRRRSHQWRNTVGVGDEALAEIIRQDRVDILVDLSQHTAGNRLPMFARKPAPVQVSFAACPESPGLETIEYRISDPHLEGSSVAERMEGIAPSMPWTETERKEKVCPIDSYWCYDPSGIDLKVNPLPSSQTGAVTFGCLNHFYKINEQALSLWARTLAKSPPSRLIILTAAGSHRQRTLETLEKAGVAAHRVEFVEYLPREEYLKLYHRIDIVLDTFPYNGHTTSLDALWMGVPVISLAGHTPASRAGLSHMTNLGLPELAAHSESEFVTIAATLAGDLPRLAQLRATLRARMENSVLMDAPRFARNIEAAYRSIWQRWCAGQPAIHEK